MEQICFFGEEEYKSKNKIELFKNRECKAKDVFYIKEISKTIAYDFVKKYHYLKDSKFFSKFQFGVFLKENDEILGVSTFSNPQGISALKSWFNLENSNQSVLELSRLCMHPSLNGSNATSFLLSNSIKLLKKNSIKAVITLADNNRHVGSIYQICNFKYFGLTDPKTDFYSENGKKNPRGSTKNVRGVWIKRSRKHRYCFILDKNMECNYKEEKNPIKNNIKSDLKDCCEGEGRVFDNRFNVNYKCPKCLGFEDGLSILDGY